jgi:hypothetical protein
MEVDELETRRSRATGTLPAFLETAESPFCWHAVGDPAGMSLTIHQRKSLF